jgi:N-acetylmuramate 1-kinase
MAISMIPPAGAHDFLSKTDWAGARVEPLAGDASFRRYFRVIDGDRTSVLMDAPPPQEDPRPFIAMAEWLTERGFSAPRILHRDLDQGLLLIEDFGNVRMRETLDAAPHAEMETYRGVVDVLIALHKHQAPPLAQAAVEIYCSEVELFLDWYCPEFGLEVDREGFAAAWHAVIEPVMAALTHRVVTLRDYHAENIMLITGQDGIAHYGLLDFQDALAGHPAYDLASMLEDARRDVTPAVETEMLRYYREQTSAGEDFETAYWVLAGQRNMRILGLFVRLWRRDNKPHYTSFQKRMWGLMERNLAQPALAPVKAWFDANVPVAMRSAIWDNVKP